MLKDKTPRKLTRIDRVRNKVSVKLLGRRFATQMGLNKPLHLSPDNKVVTSYIVGIDDQPRS